jgi:hypothetical protein
VKTKVPTPYPGLLAIEINSETRNVQSWQICLTFGAKFFGVTLEFSYAD